MGSDPGKIIFSPEIIFAWFDRSIWFLHEIHNYFWKKYFGTWPPHWNNIAKVNRFKLLVTIFSPTPGWSPRHSKKRTTASATKWSTARPIALEWCRGREVSTYAESSLGEKNGLAPVTVPHGNFPLQLLVSELHIYSPVVQSVEPISAALACTTGSTTPQLEDYQPLFRQWIRGGCHLHLKKKTKANS